MADRRENTLTYKQSMSRQETYRVIKAVGYPLIVFGLALFTISSFANFGTKLITPLSGGMWFVGFVVALLMPAQRKEIINQTLGMLLIYYLALLGLKVLLGVVSGVSSEMIAASYDQAIPTATGNAIPGYLQTMMWFTSVLTPIGHIGMQVKRLKDFKHNESLNRTFGRVRSIRDSGRESTRTHQR